MTPSTFARIRLSSRMCFQSIRSVWLHHDWTLFRCRRCGQVREPLKKTP